jgi:hypothetical protein
MRARRRDGARLAAALVSRAQQPRCLLLPPPHTAQVYALGFVSVFDQILDGFDVGERDKIFSAYVQSLGEDAAQYRVSGDTHNDGRRAARLQPHLSVAHGLDMLTHSSPLHARSSLVLLQADAELLESQARGLSGPDGLVPDASGNELQQALAQVAASTQADKFAYNRFFAVGLFR